MWGGTFSTEKGAGLRQPRRRPQRPPHEQALPEPPGSCAQSRALRHAITEQALPHLPEGDPHFSLQEAACRQAGPRAPGLAPPTASWSRQGAPVPTCRVRLPVAPAGEAPVLPRAGLAHDGREAVEAGEPGPLQTEQRQRCDEDPGNTSLQQHTSVLRGLEFDVTSGSAPHNPPKKPVPGASAGQAPASDSSYRARRAPSSAALPARRPAAVRVRCWAFPNANT